MPPPGSGHPPHDDEEASIDMGGVEVANWLEEHEVESKQERRFKAQG